MISETIYTPHSEAFEDFKSSYTSIHYQNLRKNIEPLVGFTPPLSTTPFFLSEQKFKEITHVVQSIIKLLADETFQKDAYGPWHLPLRKFDTPDFFGCVDFHLMGDTQRIVEVNFGAPGSFGAWEIIEKTFYSAFDLKTRPLNRGFEDKVVDALIGPVSNPRVAIAVSSLPSSAYFYRAYRYLQSVFEKRGVEAQVVFADKVETGKNGLPSWDSIEYNRVFNLLIPFVWSANREHFKNYTRAFEQNPELFFPSPLGSKICDKRLLTRLCNLTQNPYSLTGQESASIENASAKAFLLSDFQNVDEILDIFERPEKTVLKPYEQYRTRGVILKPSLEQLKYIFDKKRSDYIVQEYFQADPFPYMTPEGSPATGKYELRVGFLQNEITGILAYRGSNDIAPVAVV